LQSITGRQELAYRHIILQATQIAKNCRRQQPHSHLRPPPRATHAIIRICLIFPETRVIGLHFCHCKYGSIFIQICAMGSKIRIFSATECVLAVQGHPRSLILVPIESAYATSYLSPIVTIYTVFQKKVHPFCFHYN